MTSRSFRLDMVETREQWVVIRTSACRRQHAGFPRHPVLRCLGACSHLRVSPEVVFEYLKTVIWVEWRRVARGAHGA